MRRLPSGRWLARVTVGVRVDGSPRSVSKTLDTEAEAEAWVAAKSVEMGAKPDLGAGVTVSALCGMYERVRMPELARTTQSAYRGRIRAICDVVGDRDVSSLSHGDVQRMLAEMRPSVAQKTATVLSAVLTFGVRAGVLSENVMLKAPMSYGSPSPFAAPDDDVWDDDPFAAIESRRDVWDARTVIRCMGMIRGLALEPVWLACVGGGLRVEEAIALRPRDMRRIVGSFDEWGHEVWVTQVAVHHATTREEVRKATKNARSVRIVPVMEPFGERLWELAQGTPKSEPVCRISAARQNKAWRNYFEEPPEEWPKRMSEERRCMGRLHGLPYLPLSRMRATHATLMQEAGTLDSINAAIHGHTEVVERRHYLSPDATEATIRASRGII